MPRVLINVTKSDWDVHFIAPDGRTRIGPWLLMDNHDQVRAILRWGNVSAEELEEHESSIRRWGVSSVGLDLTEKQLDDLIERGRGWPWNGYELRLMKEAGKYPPTRLTLSHPGVLKKERRIPVKGNPIVTGPSIKEPEVDPKCQ